MRLRQRERERVNRKYRLEENGTLHVSDMLKQKIKAGGIKIKRYMMRDVNSSNKINNFEITRNFSMELWMERKDKGQNNLTQLKQPPLGGWRKLSRNSVQQRCKRISTSLWRILELE